MSDEEQKLLVGRDGRRRSDPESKARLVAACLEPSVLYQAWRLSMGSMPTFCASGSRMPRNLVSRLTLHDRRLSRSWQRNLAGLMGPARWILRSHEMKAKRYHWRGRRDCCVLPRRPVVQHQTPHSSLDRQTPDPAYFHRAGTNDGGRHNQGGNPLSKTPETVQTNRATSVEEEPYLNALI